MIYPQHFLLKLIKFGKMCVLYLARILADLSIIF